VSSNPAHGEVCSIQRFMIKFVMSVVSSTNKTDLENMTEILLKVALNAITLTLTLYKLALTARRVFFFFF